MSRYAILESNVVINIVEAEEEFAKSRGWIAALTAGIGDIWTGKKFTSGQTQVQVPKYVEMRQARLALLSAGLLDEVGAFVAISDRAAQIEWEFAQTVQRSHPLIAALQSQKNMTDEQIDNLFIEASKL